VVKVKICGVTTAGDARLAARAGASAVGLNFFPASPRYVSFDAAEEIVTALPAGVCRVGVFVDAPRAEVEATAERLRLDALQFHGDEDPEYCRGWRQKIIKAVRVRDPQSLRLAAAYAVDFILADAHVEGRAGGTGRRVPLEYLEGIERRRLILAGGLTPENVAEVVRRVRPAAVDVASGVETAPGRKDAEKVRRFVCNAQSA
jgi:phosphoribosylanthranilate isomerase